MKYYIIRHKLRRKPSKYHFLIFMLMNEILKTKLFSLLADTSQVTNYEMQQAYEPFVKEVETLNQPETDYPTIFRILNITRIELVFLLKQFQCEQGGKCA